MSLVCTRPPRKGLLLPALQSVMILIGAGVFAFGILRMQPRFAPPEHDSPSPGASEKGFVPVMGAPAGHAGEIFSPSTAANQPRWKFERALGAEAGEPSGQQAVPMAQNRPVRIVIPDINLDAPIVSAALLWGEVDDQRVYQWSAPDFFAGGWHYDSAELGEHGNTVINGHHNVFGEVFRDLDLLQAGDRIFVYANESPRPFPYEVTNVLILEERFQPLEHRAENARWIRTTQDERLTLITCWPYESNTHRLIVVAKPIIDAVPGALLESE